MTTIMINRFRKVETTNTGVMVQTTQVAFDLFRTAVYNAELDLLEVVECGRGQIAFNSIAIAQHNNMVYKYTQNEEKTAQIVYESFSKTHKYIKTNLELKGRGIDFRCKSDKGENVYIVTKRAFERLKTQYATKFAA